MTPAKNRQYLVALLYVSGLDAAEIARRTDYDIKYIHQICASALFKAQVATLQKQLGEEMVRTVIERIEDEAPLSMDVLMQIRNGEFDPSNKDTVKLQLDAVKFHLGDLYMDRFHPKVTKQESDQQIRITFDQDALRQMMGAVAEDKGETIVISDYTPAAVTLLKDPSLLPMTVDQAVEALDGEDAFP
jgi:hypothetical protein